MDTKRRRAVLAWSSGKDSLLALDRIRREGTLEVATLLTTVSEGRDRVAIHDVREALLDRQAAALGLPLEKVRLPLPCPNAVYETRVGEVLARWKRAGVATAVFGDLFLEDIRRYRDGFLERLGLEPRYPLWGEPTEALAREMLARGVRAILTSVDTRRLPAAFAGRAFDEKLLAELPAGVDPCGENGEFHTFCWDGPGFRSPVPVSTGERTEKDGFAYVDLKESSSRP